ncbi:MAG: hypothetical protein QM651_19285, partial [Rhodoblastus sp.]
MVARMSSRLRQSRASYGIAALYALAMVLLGFAHKPIPLRTIEAVSLAAYALPDGTLPDICQHDPSSGQHEARDIHCDACALSHAPGLLAPADICFPTAKSYRLAAWSAPHGQFAPAATAAPVSRGPP